MATQGVPKGIKGCPKGPTTSPKAAQGEEKGIEGHPKERNKSESYIHLNKVCVNADPSPYSCKLVSVTTLVTLTMILVMLVVIQTPIELTRIILG